MLTILLVGVVLLAATVAALAIIHRLGEWDHHAYYGAVLIVVAFALRSHAWALPLALVGLVLLADDCYQHATQALGELSGLPPRADFTTIHRVGAWIVQRWRDMKASRKAARRTA